MTPHLPPLRTLARRAIPRVIEGTLVPLALFYGALWVFGLWPAIGAGLAWSYSVLLFRAVTRRPLPGLLVLAAAGLTARTALAFATGSAFFYFLQPSLTTVAIAAAFLLSVPAGRPLAERLARDFVALPPEVLSRPCVRRVFARITVLWGVVNLVNAGVTIVLLVTQSVPVYVAAKTGTSLAAVGVAIAISAGWFFSVLRHHEPVPVPVALRQPVGAELA
jgi:hypothetical protein